MIDITNAKKAINVNEVGSTMIRRAAKRESPVRINLNRRGGSPTFNELVLFLFSVVVRVGIFIEIGTYFRLHLVEHGA